MGVAPEVNLREHTLHMPLPSVDKAAHSGLQPRGDIIRSPKQVYQEPHKRTCVHQNVFIFTRRHYFMFIYSDIPKYIN